MIDLYDKKVKEHIGFYYLLTETQELEILLRIEYVPKEVLKKIKDKSITRNIFRTQDE